MTEMIAQLFLAACRVAAVWPNEHRNVARKVLIDAPNEMFSWGRWENGKWIP